MFFFFKGKSSILIAPLHVSAPAEVFVGVVMLNFSAPRVDKESVADVFWPQRNWIPTFRRP